MNRFLIIVTIASLLFSTVLLAKEFRTVERWQAKGLRIHQVKVDDYNDWKTNINPGKPEQWLTANPVFIALKAWIEMFSNLASLSIVLISGVGFYSKKRKQRMEKI